ncbi:MAG: NADH-quinone oxidoreductase subunit J [Nitriliruptoraceae bacterium]|nr:NADH-quinone oxidoreductase subunit J [Nitriliruptoraceae bacterium]
MTVLALAAEAVASGTSEVVLFWVFAVLALGAAIAVITMRNIVHGALMLVVNFLAIAGLYLTLESSFLSIIQVLVYAGAIMVLFLFVIMLLGVDNDDLLAADVRGRVGAVLGGALLAGALTFAFLGPYTGPASVCGPDAPAAGFGEVDCVGLGAVVDEDGEVIGGAYDEDDASGVAFLGRAMFTRYTYPFELAALLLTVATIGAVILARRRDLAPEDLDDADELGPDADGDGETRAEVGAARPVEPGMTGEAGDAPGDEPSEADGVVDVVAEPDDEREG